jgi:hypothetical protein
MLRWGGGVDELRDLLERLHARLIGREDEPSQTIAAQIEGLLFGPLRVTYDHMALDLRAYIMAERVRQFRWPAGWWQALKERAYRMRIVPRRVKTRWPVAWCWVNINRCFPDIAMPGHTGYIIATGPLSAAPYGVQGEALREGETCAEGGRRAEAVAPPQPGLTKRIVRVYCIDFARAGIWSLSLCCASCHEDLASGFGMSEREVPEDLVPPHARGVAEVCCELNRALDQRVLSAEEWKRVLAGLQPADAGEGGDAAAD